MALWRGKVLLGEDNFDENDHTLAERYASQVAKSTEGGVDLEPSSKIGWPVEVGQVIAQMGCQSLQFRRNSRPTIGQILEALAKVGASDTDSLVSPTSGEEIEETAKLSPNRVNGEETVNTFVHQWGVALRENFQNNLNKLRNHSAPPSE